MTGYVELHCHSNYSFLDGASHPEDLAARAAELEMPALALTDHDGLYAAIIFYKACQEAGVKPIIGAELTLEGGHHLTLRAKDDTSYSNLCRWITKAHRAHSKGNPSLDVETLADHARGLLCLSGCRRGEIAHLALQGKLKQAYEAAARYRNIFGKDNYWLELQNNFYPEDKHLCETLVALAKRLKVGYVATNNVHYATEEGYKLHDVLVSLQNRSTLDECQSLRLNSEFYLKSGTEMTACLRDYPEALANTVDLAQACKVDLDFSAYRFPDFPLPAGETADTYLTKICHETVATKYETVTPKTEQQLSYELDLIRHLNLSGYFLIVWDIMDYARRNNIPAQGRGSAANSIVAYILGITRVDPIYNRLFVGRFINEEMSSLPDIDIDISTTHREQLIQYVYNKYGEDHTAMVCTYVTYQARNAIREVGKALGLPAHVLDKMARSVSAYGASGLDEDLGKLEEFRPYLNSTLWGTFTALCRQIADYPRHLSIHVGGMLIWMASAMPVSLRWICWA
jgi:error-prone DNA polymerase